MLIRMKWIQFGFVWPFEFFINRRRSTDSLMKWNHFSFHEKIIITQPMKVAPIMSQSIWISIHFVSIAVHSDLGQTVERNWIFFLFRCIQTNSNWWNERKHFTFGMLSVNSLLFVVPCWVTLPLTVRFMEQYVNDFLLVRFVIEWNSQTILYKWYYLW